MNTRNLAARFWREWIRPLVLPAVAIFAAKSTLADINVVPSGSMEPTVLAGDVVFVNKLAYDLKIPFTTRHVAEWANPGRGDIVVCFSPEDGVRLLKRVVGTPGDTVELRHEQLLINGTPVAYSELANTDASARHLPPDERHAALFARERLGARSHVVMVLPRVPALRTFGPLKVPEGCYFVMGDNRDNSKDSRFFGVVPRAEIVGEAKAVFVSVDLRRWGQPRFARFCSALE